MNSFQRGTKARHLRPLLLVLLVATHFTSSDANLFSPPFLRRAGYSQKQQTGSVDASDEGSELLVSSSNLKNINIIDLNMTEVLDNPPPPIVVNRVSSSDVDLHKIPSISDINRQISMQHQQLPVQDRRTVTRPQVRSLDGRSIQPVATSEIRAPVRAPGQPTSVYVNRRPTHNRRSTTSRRNSRNGQKVSEGHRLITRALWRIFDALMEKNEKDELKERMSVVENGLTEMISYSGKLEDVIDMIKEENLGQDERLDELSVGLTEVKTLSRRVRDLDEWRTSFGGAQNDAENLFPVAAVNPPTAYTTCPPYFESLRGECFLLGDSPKLTWGEARRECSKYGADLAAPKSLDSLREFLQNQAYLPEYVWVGASRQGNGDWVWSAGPEGGRRVQMDTYTWNDNLPSGLGNCMGLYEGSGYRAYDYKCEELDLYVCQFFLGEA